MTDAQYTTIDLNDTSTTSTIYDGDESALIYGVAMQNGGTSAVAQLEVTDGTDTAVLTPGQTAGDGIDYRDTVAVSKNDDLQINVTTAEGSAQTNEAVVLRGRPGELP